MDSFATVYVFQRAARRLVKYWDYRKQVFQDRAFLSIRLDDGAMYPEDESTLKWGHTEILPDDKNGRLVLSHDRSNFKLDEMNHPSVVRFLLLAYLYIYPRKMM